MPSSPRRRDRWFRPCLWAFRVTITLAAVIYLFQAVTAGQFLDGDYAFLRVHLMGATVGDITMFSALIATACLKWVARGPLTPFLGVLGAIVVAQAQVTAGFNRMIWLHVPLGVVLIGLVWALAWSAWAAKAWQRPRR